MTAKRLIRPTMHQRERKGIRAQCTQAVRDYSRDGLSGVVRALGVGDPSDWDQDSPEGMNGPHGAENGGQGE